MPDETSFETVTLLTLPLELRNQIWNIVFAQQDVTPEESFNPYRHHCSPCNDDTLEPHWFHDVFRPLFTCKQIWKEGHPTFFSIMHVHLSSYSKVQSIIKREPTKLLEKVRRLTMYLHLDEENRSDWSVAMTMMFRACPNLKTLTLHNHMRPPMSYETLRDAVFFAAPIAQAELTQRSITPTIHYDYLYEDVMFASPFLGEIRCSDALEEHSAVVRDLIADLEFQRAAPVHDFEIMTGRLVAIARSYEQPWFQRLQRRRIEQLTNQSQEADSTAGENGSADGSSASHSEA